MKFIILLTLAAGSLYMLFRNAKKDREESFRKMPASISRWKNEIENASLISGVPVEIIASVMMQESSGNPDARGSAAEIGLMQLKNIAIRDIKQFNMSVRDTASFDPAENVADGAQFLRLQYRRAKDWYNALRAYNAGYSGSQNDSDAGASYARSVLARAVDYGWKGSQINQ